MADLAYAALMASGIAAWWWRHVRPQRRRARPQAELASDAEIALHVAGHEARTRGHELSALHVLYGLLQDDAITAAIARTGGDPAALEDEVLRALETPPGDGRAAIERLFGHALAGAGARDRRATCVDLWAHLGDDEAVAALIARRAIDRGAVLFELIHGEAPPDVPRDAVGPVVVVLRNDDYTRMDLVTRVLREVFELSDERATEVMLAAHGTGRAEIGAFPPQVARARIEETRARARALTCPLWIGVALS